MEEAVINKENLEGVSGWLSTYVFWQFLIIFLLFYFITQNYTNGLFVSIQILIIILLINNLFLILIQSKKAPLWNKISLFILLAPHILKLLSEENNKSGTLFWIFFLLLWLEYWHKSKRIKKTFRCETHTKSKKINKIKIFFVIFFFIIIFLVEYINFNTEPKLRNETIFTFINTENNFSINGNVSIDDKFYGVTHEGNISVYRYHNSSVNITFKGIYNNKRFEFIYEFPKNYLNYSYMVFGLSQKEIDESEEYFRIFDELKNDKYPHINKIHWTHMPLTYRYTNKYACPNSRIQRVEDAIKEFDRATNSTIKIIETNESKVDLIFICKQYISHSQEENLKLGDALPWIIKNKIYNASINFYPDLVCGSYPVVEIHEILHAFGYEHNTSRITIMSPILKKCDTSTEIDENGNPIIDKWIIKDLIETYKN